VWTRDPSAEIASAKLALEKFDPAFDQTGRGGKCIPLLCPEGCHLLVAECRKVVKNER